MMRSTRLVLAGAAIAGGLVGITLGGHLAGATRQGPDLVSRFVRTDAERVARSACASQSPFVVLDTFGFIQPANVENGSAIRPGVVRHGDLVAAIVETSHPGVVGYQTDPAFSVRTLAADIGRLAGDIESGRIAKPAAVVSSIVLPVDLRDVDAALPRAAPFAGADMAERRAELLAALTGGSDPRNAYAEIARQLSRLRAASVPVFVAAGNTGPDQTVNMLALVEGVYAVGALDRDGARAAYTSAPTLVSVWSPGFVIVSEAPGGLSVSGGRRVELEGASLPQERAVISEFVGRKAESVVREVPKSLIYMRAAGPSRQRYRYLGLSLAPGLYRTADLMAAYGHDAALATFARAVEEGPYMHFPSDMIFRADLEGRLIFDPARDRSAGQVKVADATSFAAPNLCATALSADPSGPRASGS